MIEGYFNVDGGHFIHPLKRGKILARPNWVVNCNLKPQIVISTNGDVTPFTIYVGRKGKKPLYAISGDADGNVTSRELL